MLDPYPHLSPGVSLAANHVFNYHYLFSSLHNTLRYGKGNYLQSLPQLRANAEGFKEAYIVRSKRDNLHIEVFLKLVTMTFAHYQLLNEKLLSREQVIRYGTKAQIAERFVHFLKQLEQFP
ncbi:hypothetical protein R0K17_18305, partial [Planococcus sp. SIMBA_143]